MGLNFRPRLKICDEMWHRKVGIQKQDLQEEVTIALDNVCKVRPPLSHVNPITCLRMNICAIRICVCPIHNKC
jgi:hypothetical protein